MYNFVHSHTQINQRYHARLGAITSKIARFSSTCCQRTSNFFYNNKEQILFWAEQCAFRCTN